MSGRKYHLGQFDLRSDSSIPFSSMYLLAAHDVMNEALLGIAQCHVTLQRYMLGSLTRFVPESYLK